ncbi:MAG: UbiD family decarboxylase [Chloroflexota bacterium]
MGKDLRQFLKAAREAGPDYYAETNKPLSPQYEVCVLSQKLAREGRFPLLYCPQIEGSKLPLVNGIFASYELLGLALDVTPDKLKKVGNNGIFREYRRRQDNLRSPQEIPGKDAPVQEVVLQGKDVDLGLLPIIHHYELNPAKYVSFGMTIVKDPDTGVPNVGVYRQEVKGKNRLACMPTPIHDTAVIARRYAELGKPMEVVTFIGHHPLVGMGAVGTYPLGQSELDVMGALLEEPLEVTKGVTVDLPVPAFAEIAIEGIIDPAKTETDGPFSEAYGYYGGHRSCYVIEIKAITMRKDAIYQNLDPINPEHNLAAQLYYESELYDSVRRVIPTVKAVHHAPLAMAGKHFMFISIKKRNPGDGRLAGLAALCANRARKIAVVVDEDIDVYNHQEVLWAIGNRVRGELDIDIIPRMPSIMLSPCSRDETGLSKGLLDTNILIDATEPEGFATRVMPPADLWESMSLEDYLK